MLGVFLYVPCAKGTTPDYVRGHFAGQALDSLNSSPPLVEGVWERNAVKFLYPTLSNREGGPAKRDRVCCRPPPATFKTRPEGFGGTRRVFSPSKIQNLASIIAPPPISSHSPYSFSYGIRSISCRTVRDSSPSPPDCNRHYPDSLFWWLYSLPYRIRQHSSPSWPGAYRHHLYRS